MALLRAKFKDLDLIQPLLSNQFHVIDIESKFSLNDEEDHIALLRKKRAEILRCIKLLKAGVRKRNRPIQISMLLIMTGTAIYMMVNQWIRLNEFKNENIDSLTNQQLFLENNIKQLNNLTTRILNNITNLDFLVECPGQRIGGPCFSRRLCHPENPDYYDNCIHDPWSYSPPDVTWYTGNCGIVNIQSSFGECFEKDQCADAIYNFCYTLISIDRANFQISKIQDNISKLIGGYVSAFYESIGGMAIYYLLTCGLGEVAPSVIIMLTLLTHMFTNCLNSRFFNLSEEDADEILDAADKYEIDGNLTSYSKILKNFQNELPALEDKLNLFDRRLAFSMASRTIKTKKTPLSLLFNDPQLGEPKLARIIFEMACLTEDIQLLEASKKYRHVFELGSHPRNTQPTINGVNPLFSFFDKLKNQRSEVEEYENKQGKYSRENVVRNIYEHAGFLPVSKKA